MPVLVRQRLTGRFTQVHHRLATTHEHGVALCVGRRLQGEPRQLITQLCRVAFERRLLHHHVGNAQRARFVRQRLHGIGIARDEGVPHAGEGGVVTVRYARWVAGPFEAKHRAHHALHTRPHIVRVE